VKTLKSTTQKAKHDTNECKKKVKTSMTDEMTQEVASILEERGYEVIHTSSNGFVRTRNRVLARETYRELDQDILEDHINRRIDNQVQRQAVKAWKDNDGALNIGKKTAKIHRHDDIVWVKIWREVNP